MGGVFASLIYRQADFPTYLPGIYATIACQILMLLLLVITTTYYRAQNNGLKRGTINKPLEGTSWFCVHALAMVIPFFPTFNIYALDQCKLPCFFRGWKHFDYNSVSPKTS